MMNTIFKKKRDYLLGSYMIVLLVAMLFLMGIYTGTASTQDELILAIQKKVVAGDGDTPEEFGYSVAISGDTAVVGARFDDDKGADSGSAYIFERNGSSWTEIKKLLASDGVGNDLFGESVATSGDKVIVGAYGDDDNGSASGSAYIFERNQGGTDNWGQVKKITASDGMANDYFSDDVAISGDTVIVGAYGDDDNGAAYIFERNYGGADNWGQRKKLLASDGESGDTFGRSVSISGDTALVGADNDDDNGIDSGSAYIFQRNQGGVNNWGEVAKLLASDGAASDWFGSSTSISGDTTVVGSRGDDDNGAESGSAYIFERNQGGADNWGQLAKLTASDGAGSDQFSVSVAISDDIIIIGSDYDDDQGPQSGSAYIFYRNRGGANNWGQAKKVIASDGAGGDYLGNSVSISGDTTIVGAYWDDDNGLESGSAYFYHILKVSENKVIASDGDTPEEFGYSVAIQGDTAIVGAQYDDDKGTESGSAYVFERTGDSWIEISKLLPSDGVANDLFGASVSIWGDIAVVGAWGDDDKGSNSGSAYIFYRDQGGVDNWGEKTKIIASDGAANDYFGFSVSIHVDTVIVGVWQLSGNGAAYVYYRNSGGADNWGQVKKITASDAAPGDMFGYSVSVSGDSAVVGAYGNDDAGSLSGSAYIFDRDQVSADNWGQVKKLTASDASGDDRFGYSVAISGDLALVGAIYDDDNGADSGSAYVFDRNNGGSNNWGETAKLTASDGFNSDRFGWSVAISGDTGVIGSYLDDDAGSASGSAYIFDRNEGGADNWGQAKKLTASDAAGGDQFGTSVAISGHTAAVGAHYDDDNGLESGSGYFYELDLEGSVVLSITRYDPPAADTNAATVSFMVTFDETAHNVRQTNLGLSLIGGQSTAAISSMSSSCGTTVTVSILTVDGDEGTIHLDVVSTPTITDTWFRPLAAEYYGGETYNVDRLDPIVLMSSTAPDPTSTLPIPVTVTFSEAVTGFQEADISISNGGISNFNTVNAYTYTFDITGCTQGEVTADIPGDVAFDSVGNPNDAAPQFSRTYQFTGVKDWFLFRLKDNPGSD